VEDIFFNNWNTLIKRAIMTVLAYFAMVLLLRVSGKRTLSKMNAFDFIVTVALGSSLATVALNNKITITDGAVVFSLLIFLQFLLTWLSVRIRVVKKLITSSPVIILYKGELLSHNMKKERVTLEEINLAAREKGISELKDIDAIVLETTGELTVIKEMTGINPETIDDVEKSPLG
jgi:uncharacterized membrane protein YcaP (DUF421 family)